MNKKRIQCSYTIGGSNDFPFKQCLSMDTKRIVVFGKYKYRCVEHNLNDKTETFTAKYG